MADFSSKKGKFYMKSFEANDYCLLDSPIHSSENLNIQHCDLLSDILEQKCLSNREIWANFQHEIVSQKIATTIASVQI